MFARRVTPVAGVPAFAQRKFLKERGRINAIEFIVIPHLLSWFGQTGDRRVVTAMASGLGGLGAAEGLTLRAG